MKKRMRTRKINYPKLFTDTFILVILAWVLIQIFLPSFDILSIYERMPELLTGNSGLIINGEIIRDNSPIIYDNGEVMLPVSILTKYVDDTIIQNDKYVICANKSTYIRYEVDEIKYVLNGRVKKGKTKPIYKDGMIYIPMSLVSDLYGITFNYIKDSNILIMNLAGTYDLCLVTSDDVMRETNSIKSSIVGNVYISDEVTRYDTDNTWSKVINKDGITGYVKNSSLTFKENIYNVPSDNIELSSGLTYGSIDVSLSNDNDKDDVKNDNNEKINLVWYQVNNKSSNPKLDTLKVIPGVTHLCFSWFDITDKEGNVREKIDDDIVKWAHKNNYKIWAMVTNPFSNSDLTHEMLSNPVSRENAISQMMNYINKYNIDGLNVDIESIKSKTGEYYVQFIRELSVFARLNDIELSLDMYMPSQGTSFYKRDIVQNYVSYYILMAYDEHWETCPEAGSVASLPWVEKGITETLKDVPANKLVLGIPLYTRRWEVDKNNKVNSVKNFGMDNAKNDLLKNKVKITFDKDTKQNYGEYKLDKYIYKIWLEDEVSIKERLELAKGYNLRGVASWKKGFDNDTIWKLYEDYMK